MWIPKGVALIRGNTVFPTMKTLCPSGYHHKGLLATHARTWAHDVWLHTAGTDESNSAQKAKPGV